MLFTRFVIISSHSLQLFNPNGSEYMRPLLPTTLHPARPRGARPPRPGAAFFVWGHVAASPRCAAPPGLARDASPPAPLLALRAHQRPRAPRGGIPCNATRSATAPRPPPPSSAST